MKMKAKMYSAKSNTRLHKMIDEFFTSNEGIDGLRARAVVKDEEYIKLVQRNIAFFYSRIKEFRLAEKMLSIFFAFLFTWMQVNGDDVEDLRKPTRSRTNSGRTVRAPRSGRKRG
jgi:hypothetical protein